MQLITEGGGAAGAWPAPSEGNMTYGIHATLHRMESFDGSVNARRLRLQRLSHANEPFFVTIHRGVSWCLSFVCCHPRWEVCFWQARHNRCNIAPENPPVKAVAAGVRHTCALTRDIRWLCSEKYVPEALRTSCCQTIAACEDVNCVLTAGHCTPVID